MPRPALLTFITSREVRFEVISTILLMAFSYFFLLWLYPLPNVYADTGAYIAVAETGLIGSYRPAGYSWFMALAHFIDPNPDVLVLLQTLAYFFSTLVYYLTARYYFRQGPIWAWRTFFLLFLLSPTCIYLCNFVISDCLFIALTNLWLASQFWILGSRRPAAVLWNAVFLLLLLQVRYIALFYPLITVAALFFAFFKTARLRFFIYSALQVALFVGVISFTTWQTKKNTGVAVFSGFSGWQKANNAMHLLPYINLRPELITDPEIRQLHAFILANNPASLYPPKDSVVTAFLWSPDASLKKYLYHLKGKDKRSYLYYWHLTSIPFGKWADYMVMKYPLHYLRYYIRPNACNLFDLYNEALFVFPEPSQQMKDWFHCNNCEVKPRFNFYHDLLDRFASQSFNILWGLFFLTLLVLPFRSRLSSTPLQYRMLLLVLFFCITYSVMSVYASPLVFRYLLVIRHSLLLLPLLTLILALPIYRRNTV